MKKIYSILALTMAMLLMLTGCSMVQINAERDGQTVVAVVNGKDILKKDYEQNFQRTLIQSGMDINNLDAVADEYVTYYAASALETMINQEVMLLKAKEMGLDTLTEEEKAEIQKEYDEIMETMRAMAESLIINDLLTENADMTEEEQKKAIEKMSEEDRLAAIEKGVDSTLSSMFYTRESFLENLQMYAILDKVEAKVTEDIEPAQEDIDSAYTERAASAKETYTNTPISYETAYMDKNVIYYVPAGARIVQHILIALPEEQTKELTTYRSEGKDDAADTIREKYLAEIKDKAQEALDKIKADPDSYLDVMAEYSDDEGTKDGSTFAVASVKAGYYVEEFAQAAMNMKEIGEITDLVGSDYGYHILRCEDIPTSGPVPQSEVQEIIYDELRSELVTEKMNELLTTWKTEYAVQTFTDRLV